MSENESNTNIKDEEKENEESEEMNSNEEEEEEEIKEKINNSNNEIQNKFPFSEKNSEGKSIFSEISENLYSQYLNTDSNKKVDIYKELTNNDYLNYHNKKKNKIKNNEDKYNKLLERLKSYEESRQNRIKEKIEQQKLEIERNCPFKPNNKKVEKIDPKTFYEEQIRFLKEKNNYIESLTRNKIENEEIKNNKKLISKNSEQIMKNKNPNESKEDTLKRLTKGKSIFTRSQTANTNNEKKIKKSMKELTEYSNKLSLQDQKYKKEREDKKREIQKEFEKEMCKKDLISNSTKKVILNKCISNLQNILNEMFNQKENVDLTKEEYTKLLEKLKCISNNNNNNEEELIKLSFSKYLNPKDDKINSNQFIIFALSFMGIYKGKDELINSNEKKDGKIISSSNFIKSILPELDLEKYNYSNKTTQQIKKKFLSFSSKMNEGWNEEKKTKRNLKNQQNSNEKKKLEKKDKSQKNSKTNFYLTMNKNVIEKEHLLEKLRKEKEEEEMKNCTFQPNALTRPVNKKEVKEKVEKLYTDGKITYMKKLKQKENNSKENEEKFTFMPEIHPLNQEIFELNPLENDQKYLDEMIRLEKIRNTKIANLNNNNENLIPMRFDMEYKSNRDTFNNFIKKKKNNFYNRDFYSNNNEEANSFDSDVKNGVSPLLKVEVNIDDTNNIVKLVIYPGDDPMKIVEEFCEKYNLGEDKKNKLQGIIQEKLSENDNISE